MTCAANKNGKIRANKKNPTPAGKIIFHRASLSKNKKSAIGIAIISIAIDSPDNILTAVAINWIVPSDVAGKDISRGSTDWPRSN